MEYDYSFIIQVAKAYSIYCDSVIASKTGRTHQTYFLTDQDGRHFVIQHLNQHALREPEIVTNNIAVLSQYHNQHFTGDFLMPLQTVHCTYCTAVNGNIFRCFPYITDTLTVDPLILSNLYEAGSTIARFHNEFIDFHIEWLIKTMFDGHSVPFYYSKYCQIRKNVFPKHPRFIELVERIDNYMPETWENWIVIRKANLPLRIVHNDTNIENILLDYYSLKGKCMIDLDGVSSGSLIFDFGDCVQDFLIRNANLSDSEKMKAFSCFVQGYADHAWEFITDDEIKHLYHGIWLVCIELGLRFLIDYLNHNPFFRTAYQEETLEFASLQIALLDFLKEKKQDFLKIITQAFSASKNIRGEN